MFSANLVHGDIAADFDKVLDGAFSWIRPLAYLVAVFTAFNDGLVW